MDRISYLCGLGNPGSDYHRTRHNLGFDLLDMLARKIRSGWRFVEDKAAVSKGNIAGREVVMFKPLTYVNLTGKSFSLFPDLTESNLLVACDDINLDLGNIRIRSSGGSGGHNGLESIERYFNSRDYPRLRMGIGPPPEPSHWKEFVLERFTGGEQEAVEEMLSTAVRAVETVVADGIREGMQKFNRRNST